MIESRKGCRVFYNTFGALFEGGAGNAGGWTEALATLPPATECYHLQHGLRRKKKNIPIAAPESLSHILYLTLIYISQFNFVRNIAKDGEVCSDVALLLVVRYS